MKECKDCLQLKSKDCFYVRYTTKDGLYSVCKQCHKAKTKANKKYERKITVSVPNRCVPPWLTENDWEAIKRVYAESKALTEQTGVYHVVDHIYPMRGRTVSGLHVPSNLRVVPAVVNARKANKVLDNEETWI